MFQQWKYNRSVGGAMVRIFADDSDAQQKTLTLEQRLKQFNQNLADNHIKLMTLWSYGNQITSMILRQLSVASKGTEAQASIQKIIAGLQIAQQEAAIISTIMQAGAAAQAGSVFNAAMLSAIAVTMQMQIIQMQFNKIAAQKAEDLAEDLQRQIEAYRN